MLPCTAVPRYALLLARVLLAALASAVLAGCNRKVTRAECTQMLDHYVDMLIAEDPELAKLPRAQQEPARDVKKAIKKADKSYRQVEAQCETEIVRHEFDCAIGAKSPGEWEACID